MGGDNRSAVWGGGTMGLLVGPVVGFFREHYWQTVVYAVVIGALLRVAANVVAAIGNRRRS